MTFHDYASIESRLNETDIFTLIAECDTILAENPTELLRLLRSALSLSAHVLEKDKTALASQLAGRLYHHYDANGDVRAFVDSITPPKNSLYPIRNGIPISFVILKGHEKEVKGAIELHNGNILSWSADETLRLWTNNGLLLATFIGHTDEVRGAIELNNGHILSWEGSFYFTNHNHNLQLWNIDGTPVELLIGHIDEVLGTIKLRNGRILSWGYDSTLRLWNENGTSLGLFAGHTKLVKGVCELHNGQILSWGNDAILRVWDENGNLVKILTGHLNNIQGAIELQDGRFLSWGYDKNLLLWDINRNLTIIMENEVVSGVCELSDRRWLTWGDNLRLWNSDGTLLKICVGENNNHISYAVELKDKRLLSQDIFDTTLRLWDRDGTYLKSLDGHQDGINGVLELRDGRVLSWSRDTNLHLWDVQSI